MTGDGQVERMLADVAGLGAQVRATAREAAALPRLGTPSSVCIAALGGSAIGSDLCQGLWSGELRVPVATPREAALPGWVDAGSAVVAVSYSGATAETLACAEACLARGATLVAVTAGGPLGELAAGAGAPVVPLPAGLPPRVAVGHLFAAIAVILERLGVVPDVAGDLAAAADACDAVAADAGGDAARALGARLADCETRIYGGGPLAAVARRWKTQLNENADLMAAWEALPEADHNEIVGWGGAGRTGGRFAAVFLRDLEDPPRIAASAARTSELIAGDAVLRETLVGEGATRVARAFWLLAFGDHVTTYAAAAAGTDPYAIDRLDALKAHLGTVG